MSNENINSDDIHNEMNDEVETYEQENHENDVNKQSKYKSLEKLSTEFANLINNQMLSDITFLIGEKKTPIYSHKAILCQRSEYFRGLFLLGMKVKKKLKLKKKKKGIQRYIN
jgi:hypothetical protein